MRFASLGSGSKGNATLVQCGDTLLMIDCGFSVRETTRRMLSLGLTPQQLTAILVTHEHGDHCSGVGPLSRKHQIPVHLTHGTASAGRCEKSHQLCCFNAGDTFQLGDITVAAITVPHDAVEPCQFRLDGAGRSLGVLTDLGCITPHVANSYGSCHSLMLEFNHDTKMLQAGRYPPHLKRRVGGDWGHLNNEQAASLLRQLDATSLENLVIAHISENNNSRARAEYALSTALDSLEKVVWAQQETGFGWLTV